MFEVGIVGSCLPDKGCDVLGADVRRIELTGLIRTKHFEPQLPELAAETRGRLAAGKATTDFSKLTEVDYISSQWARR